MACSTGMNIQKLSPTCFHSLLSQCKSHFLSLILAATCTQEPFLCSISPLRGVEYAMLSSLEFYRRYREKCCFVKVGQGGGVASWHIKETLWTALSLLEALSGSDVICDPFCKNQLCLKDQLLGRWGDLLNPHCTFKSHPTMFSYDFLYLKNRMA